jgi:hypothetical protein
MLILGFLNRARSAVLFESDDPWATEVVAYANGAVALGSFFFFWLVAKLSSIPSLGLALLLLVLLRLCLTRRVTTWVAAVVSTLFLSAVAGGLGWMLAQCIEVRAVPELVALAAALAGGALPAHAYRRLIAARLAIGQCV